MKLKHFPLWTTLLVLAFFWIPLGTIVFCSVLDGHVEHVWRVWQIGDWEVLSYPVFHLNGSFTTAYYHQLWTHPRIWSALANSVSIGLMVTLISMVIGTLSAVVLDRFHSRLQVLHKALVHIPLILPEILMGISLLVCFTSLGIPLGRGTVIVAHTAFCTSYVAVVVLARLEDFDFSLWDAARDLGATPVQATLRIMLPLLWPGIIAGALLAFTLSLDDFIVTFFVSGKGYTTLPVYIYSQMKHMRSPEVLNALSTVMLTVTFLTVGVSQMLTSRRGESNTF